MFVNDSTAPGKHRQRDVVSQAGVAFSTDLGRTWQRPAQRQLQPPNIFTDSRCYFGCGPVGIEPCDRDCPTSLAGDPWLASNGSVVLMTNMAQTHNRSPFSSATAVALSRTTDGESWSVPKTIATVAGGEDIDKPNVAFVGSTAVVTFAAANERGFLGIRIVTSVDEGISWSSPQNLGKNPRSEGLASGSSLSDFAFITA